VEYPSLSQAATVTAPLSGDGAPPHRFGVPAYLKHRKGLLLAVRLGAVGLLAGWTWWARQRYFRCSTSCPAQR
jgi:hypothetical protein